MQKKQYLIIYAMFLLAFGALRAMEIEITDAGQPKEWGASKRALEEEGSYGDQKRVKFDGTGPTEFGLPGNFTGGKEVRSKKELEEGAGSSELAESCDYKTMVLDSGIRVTTSKTGYVYTFFPDGSMLKRLPDGRIWRKDSRGSWSF